MDSDPLNLSFFANDRVLRRPTFQVLTRRGRQLPKSFEGKNRFPFLLGRTRLWCTTLSFDLSLTVQDKLLVGTSLDYLVLE